MTRVGIVVRAPHEDSSVVGDQVGKGDMSDIKSCPKIAGYNGLGKIRGNISSFTWTTPKIGDQRIGGWCQIPKKEMEEEFLEGQKHFSLRGGWETVQKRSKTWQVATLPCWEPWAKIGSHFQLLPGCNGQNQCNLRGSTGVLFQAGTREKVCSTINQLACSIKGWTGNYFGTCECKKGQGVKREENIYYWALCGEAKELSIPFHQDTAHCPQVNSNQNTKSPPLTPITISFGWTVCCSQN